LLPFCYPTAQYAEQDREASGKSPARKCDRVAKIILKALGIESDDVVNYTFPKSRPADREVRAAR
jgi:hypothetical protein